MFFHAYLQYAVLFLRIVVLPNLIKIINFFKTDNKMNTEQKKILFEKAEHKCQKCGHYSPLGKDLEINSKNKAVFCFVCNHFAPDSEKDFKQYLNEKLDPHALDSFRKFGKQKKENLKKAMSASAEKGKIVSRPAFGYKMQEGELIPAENSDEVREIFEAFARGSSLNAIARLHKMSVNGIKKILRNFTYIGKVKFDNKILQGNHQPIISSELFNTVQQIFEKKN